MPSGDCLIIKQELRERVVGQVIAGRYCCNVNDGLFQKKKTGVVGSEDILFLFFFFALPLEIPEKNKAPPLEPSHFFLVTQPYKILFSSRFRIQNSKLKKKIMKMHFKKKVPGFRISKYMSQYSYYKALISFKLLLFHTKVCALL